MDDGWLGELEPYDCDELLCQEAKRHEAEAYQKGLSAAWDAARKIISWWPSTENDALLKRFGIDCEWGGFILDAIFNRDYPIPTGDRYTNVGRALLVGNVFNLVTKPLFK